MLELLRRKSWVRHLLSGLSVVLLLGGLGLVGYPFATNIWQDRLQNDLGDQLTSPQLQQAYREREVETGDSLTRVRIPAIDVDVVVVEGITPSALRAGAGHYPQTPLPCEAGNVAIAGHRTTYGKPFANIDQLRPGDTITLETPVSRCDYEVEKAPAPYRSPAGMPASWVVAPNDLRVIDEDKSKAELTLTTCHPKGSASQRLIVRAALVPGTSQRSAAA